MISMDMKATLKGANVKGYACVQKAMVKMLLQNYVDKPDILKSILDRLDKLPGDTIFVDLDMKLTVGNE